MFLYMPKEVRHQNGILFDVSYGDPIFPSEYQNDDRRFDASFDGRVGVTSEK